MSEDARTEARRRIAALFEPIRREVADLRLQLAVARDGMLTYAELIAKLDVEPITEESPDA